MRSRWYVFLFVSCIAFGKLMRVRKLNAQLRQEGKDKWTNVAPSVASVRFFPEDLA